LLTGATNTVYGIAGQPTRPGPERPLSGNERWYNIIRLLLKLVSNSPSGEGGSPEASEQPTRSDEFVRFVEGETTIDRRLSETRLIQSLGAYSRESSEVFGLFSLDDVSTPIVIGLDRRSLERLLGEDDRLVVQQSNRLTSELRDYVTFLNSPWFAEFESEKIIRGIFWNVTDALNDLNSYLQARDAGESPEAPSSVLRLRSNIDSTLSSASYQVQLMIFEKLNERIGNENSRIIMGSFLPALDQQSNVIPLERSVPSIRAVP
jgi:hypothetical protein